MRYLVKQLKGTEAVAQMLRISQRTVERYVKDQVKKPRPDLAASPEREVKARWQPQIRAQARKKAVTTGGIVIDTQARIGYDFQDNGRRVGQLEEVRFTDIPHLEFGL
jgi:hypothetical protein